MNIIKRYLSYIDKYSVELFLLSLFLIKIPPFYFFPPVQSALLTTHTLTRIIILLLFGILLIKVLNNKKNIYNKKSIQLIWLFIIYLFFQSLSILAATNVTSFLQRYKDIVFPGLFLFVVLAINEKKYQLVKIFLIASVINFFYQTIMFLSPETFRSLASIFVYRGHFELVNINLERARIFIESYDEIVIPFLFILINKVKTTNHRLVAFTLFILVIIPSLLSNFRTRILMLLTAFILSYIFLLKSKIKTKLQLLSLLVVIAYIAVIILNQIFGFSFIDRFALKDKREDINTIIFRFKNIGIASEMAQALPYTGVGLGNYYDYLPARKKISLSLLGWISKESQIAATNPHSIFGQIVAETGFISLLYYLLVMGIFATNDTRILITTKDKHEKKGYIIAFWTLAVYSLFNPTTTLGYNSLFWILRGKIIKQ